MPVQATEFFWSGGEYIDLGLPNPIAATDVLFAIPGGNKFTTGTITNSGRINWTTSDPLRLNGVSSRLRNNGLFDQQTDGQITATGSAGTFDNLGTLRKSGGSGDLVVGVALQNAGAIESRSGTIVLPANWTNHGTIRGTAGYRTNLLTNAGTVTPGDAAASQIATLSLTGALLQAPGGRLSFEVGAGGMADLLEVSGAVGFGGLLEVVSFAGYVPTVGDTFRVMNFASHEGVLLDVLELGFDSGVQFEALYAATHLDLRVTAVPEPTTSVMLLAGVAVLLAIRRCRRV